MSGGGELVSEHAAEQMADAFDIESSIQEGVETYLHTPSSEQDKTETQPNVVEVESKESVIARAVETFGDQWFVYKGHEGTVADIVALCPAVDFVLMGGYDAFVAWIAPHKTEQPDENKEDESAPEAGLLNQPPQKNSSDREEAEGDRSESSAPVAVAENSTPKTAPRKEQIQTEVVESPVVVEEKSSSADTGSETTASEPIVHEVEVSDSRPKIFEIIPLIKEVAPVSIETPKIDEVVAVVPQDMGEGGVTPAIDDPLEIVEDTPVNSEVFVERETIMRPEPVDVTIEDTPIEVKDELHQEPTPDTIETVFENTQLLEAAEIIPDAEENIELEETEAPIASELREEPQPKPIEYLASIQELAQKEVPLETLFVEVVEMLQPYDAEFAEDSLKNIEEDLRSESAAIELQVLHEQVSIVKEKIEWLYEAKTKEECAERVWELSASLTELLLHFGYTNSEATVRIFLQTHSVASLKELIDVLENMLQRARAIEAAKHHAVKRTKIRHITFGKLALYISNVFVKRTRVLDVA